MVNAIYSIYLMLSIKNLILFSPGKQGCAVFAIYWVLQQLNVTKLNDFPCIYLKYAQKMSLLDGQLMLNAKKYRRHTEKY